MRERERGHTIYLEVLDGPHAGRAFDCTRGPLRIGRRMPPSQVLTRDEPDVARGATQVARVGGRLVLEDHSENGVFVNGRLLRGGSMPLELGDEIRVGTTRMVIVAEPAAHGSGPRAAVELDGAKLEQLARSFPGMDAAAVVDWLVDAELARRGQPDPLTGVGHVLALLHALPRTPAGRRGWGASPQGLEGEVERWMVGADVRGLARLNDRLGLEAGDEVLVLLAAALRRAAPGAFVFRLHGDAFVAIGDAPWRFDEVRSAVEALFREGLEAAAHEPLRVCPVEVTHAAVHLVVARPHSPVVMGPLVCAEMERALVAARLSTGPWTVEHRRIVLDGHVAG